MLYRMRNYFSQKCSCYTDWQPLFRYELYFRDIAAYENEETRRISPSAFIVKKRGDVVYDDWFTIGCIIRNFFGEDGRQLFHEITKH